MDRSRRCELLAQLDDTQLGQLMTRLGSVEASIVAEPTVGMLMIRVLEDAHGETFNFGEALVTEATMRVGEAEGWAMLMGRRLEGARIAATIDAALAENEDLQPAVDEQLTAFEQQLQARQQERYSQLAPTRVRFETQ